MEAGFHSVSHYPKGSCIVRICSHASGDFQGKIFFPHASRSVAFLSAWGLIKQIENDIKHNQFPQSMFETCRWGKNKGALQMAIPEKIESDMPDRTICSFLVHVRYFQNATWQGVIHWLEGKQTRAFRSEFELLKLMEEAAGGSGYKKVQYTKV